MPDDPGSHDATYHMHMSQHAACVFLHSLRVLKRTIGVMGTVRRLVIACSTLVSVHSAPYPAGKLLVRQQTRRRCLHMTAVGATPNSSAIGSADWFQNGLKFKCEMCGNCCSGSSGSVRFTEIESENMSSKLGIPLKDFYDKYCRKRGSGSKKYYELKEKRSPEFGYDCIFLDRSTIKNKAICSLYEARPLQCRTWPFWQENLESAKTWKNVRNGIEGCAGIGNGDEITPYREIIRQRDETNNLWKENNS